MERGSLAAGTEVVLRESSYGYESGSRGVVKRLAGETAYVRFDSTGHTLLVHVERLQPLRERRELEDEQVVAEQVEVRQEESRERQ